MAIEEPVYRSVERAGAFELREYAPYLIAETRVDAGFMEAGNIASGCSATSAARTPRAARSR